MRMTNSMLVSNYLNNLNRNLTDMNRYQTQMATNKKITELSDDPAAVISSLSIRDKLDSLDLYQSAVADAKAWLSQSETAVSEINTVIKEAYEKTVQAASGTMGADDKIAIANELQELRDHLLQVTNSTYGDKYIFGGYSTSAAPFTESNGTVLYQGVNLATAMTAQVAAFDSQAISFRTGNGLSTQIALPGTELVGSGDQNLFKVLDDLIGVLKADGPASTISPFIATLQAKQSDVLARLSEIGGRMNHLDLMANRYEADTLNYNTLKSSIEDVDTTEVIMQYKIAEASYEAALSAGSKIIQPSLVDFLD